ncbi:hypothetical protein AVEN_178837-1 [Araneus ventricosus]|uniref:Uncharacterized protein n=1 Tax=Araneus ventricosus TaxID=182803 RepID=A0A4Y2BG84_ARAVE|nr:hypothetical protein AVEN_178837-1 [Araneus ventricosus]
MFLEFWTKPIDGLTVCRLQWPSGKVGAGGFQVRNPIPLKILRGCQPVAHLIIRGGQRLFCCVARKLEEGGGDSSGVILDI